MLDCDGYSCYVQDMTVSYDRYGGGCMQIVAVVVFIIEVGLSHTPGQASGAQSQSLSRLMHLPESFLRSFAHVLLFLALALFAALGFGPWAFVFCTIWTVMDEWTKRWIPGRHLHCYCHSLFLLYTSSFSYYTGF